MNWFSEKKMRAKRRVKLLLGLLGLSVVLGAITIAVLRINIVQLLFPKAGGVRADFIVDTTKVVGKMPTPWRNLAQGGEEAEPMLTDVVGLIKPLKPEYIRIDHIYDHYNVVGRGADGGLTFDWSQLDKEVEAILATGAKPFLALSYMPAAISSGGVIDLPKDWSDWATVVAQTVAHYSGRGGKNITNVYYEVWNEPDLFGGFRVYGEKNYLTLYSTAAGAAAAVSNTQPFKIGGPATTGLYKNWLVTLLKFSGNNKLRLDFFSWHLYTTDQAKYYLAVEDIKQWLEAFPERQNGLELVISEWGFNSEVNSGYDGNFGAAHTAAMAIEMMNRVDKAFSFEIKDGPDPQGNKYWGRWGLITHESQGLTTKPRYQALKMLSQLAGEQLEMTGKGTWVKGIAAKNGKNTQVILVNYDAKAKHTEKVPVTFTNLSARDFTLTSVTLNGTSGNQEVATTAAVFKHEVVMPANSLVLLELKPK